MSTTQNEVRFNDGEILTLADLHDMQRFLKSMIVDQLFGQLGSYTGQDSIQPSTNMTKYALCPTARGGFLTPTGAARTITNAPGMMCQWSANTAPDGLTPQLLSYQLAQDELLTAFAANSSGNPRIDALCVKLSYDDNQDSQTRDFEDASSEAVSSQTMYKKRRTVLAQTVVAGTPGANPAKPAAPAGYCVYAYALIPNGAGVLVFDDVWDARLPMRLARKKVYAKSAVDVGGDWSLTASGLYVQNTGVFAGAGADRFTFQPGLGSDARVVRASLHGLWATGTDLIGKFKRWNPGTGAYATPGLSAPELLFALGPGASGSTAMGNAGIVDLAYYFAGAAPAVWGNGWPNGFGAETSPTVAAQSSDLAIEVVDLGQTDTIDVAFVDVYYLF